MTEPQRDPFLFRKKEKGDNYSARGAEIYARYLLIRRLRRHLLRQEKAFGRPMVRTPRAHVARAREPDLSPLQTDGKVCAAVGAEYCDNIRAAAQRVPRLDIDATFAALRR